MTTSIQMRQSTARNGMKTDLNAKRSMMHTMTSVAPMTRGSELNVSVAASICESGVLVK